MQTSRFLLLIAFSGALVIASQAVPRLYSVVNALAGHFMAFAAKLFSCIQCSWRISAKNVFPASHFLKVIWVDTAAQATQMISLPVFQIIGWSFTLVQLKRVDVGKFNNPLVINSAVSSSGLNVSQPEPAWAKFGPVGWYGAILVNMEPEVLFNCEIGWSAGFARLLGFGIISVGHVSRLLNALVLASEALARLLAFSITAQLMKLSSWRKNRQALTDCVHCLNGNQRNYAV